MQRVGSKRNKSRGGRTHDLRPARKDILVQLNEEGRVIGTYSSGERIGTLHGRKPLLVRRGGALEIGRRAV